ncbi:CoA-transferase [Pseudonocardia sp. MH-G8]|uniref:CoA-transferase n=1 Tax=Pseudonocardia sp. MH-G8 TaxID=1854588 RepID=UPI000BA09C80|nr:CoA-transferase [Pseudonocardia sp. MH-G8]OZM83086.1 acetate CoA-transferase [Pseudonocardia sp. MH-G8]
MATLAPSPDDLVRNYVRPGMHVHLSATMSRPNALMHALARVMRGTRSLTVSVPAVHSTAHALALSGSVRQMITGFLGETYPTPRPCPLYDEVATGAPFEVEAWSLLTLEQRLMAAALGQPGALTASLPGTYLAQGKADDLVPVDSPWSPAAMAMMRPLRPDVALVHGVCADRRGNVVIRAPYGEGPWPAYAAAHGVLASVERIVDDEVIDRCPQDVVVPGQRVLGLCEAPFGAHPQSLRADGVGGVVGYRDDYAFLTETARACTGHATAADWFREWIDLPGGHAEYLAKLGEGRLAALGADDPGVTTPRSGPSEPAGRGETLIVLAARAVQRLVEAHGYDTLLAGIGASHLAAWLAAAQLRERGHQVKLAAELGFYGTDPHAGDVFLFSQRHAARSEGLSGIAEVLGGLVAGNPRCLGVLAAAEIDPTGDINTSVLPSGRWITGSGGAHDIAAAADCIVVSRSGRHRYVPRVAAVTSSGQRVRAVVSEFGTFGRERGGRFRLTSHLAGTDARTPEQSVAERTGWTCDTSEAKPEDPVTTTELALLRALDPEGHYR